MGYGRATPSTVTFSNEEKGVHYMNVTIFNSLPDYLTNLVQDKKQFTGKIMDILNYLITRQI
jgi:hypothetical protein